ncbi:putative integral membrane protein [Theileria parva strain Muguga]|uniref:putative integral membrane protein n=1 Tax=Theileria parva strain Muguga TaxID=333668 RepID=UPI001C6192D1|nr:putative integral membrane protein [Theileria parva strain Muguga]EAN33129.2 putative integral membrane protein [Theileria parva strain Muguga]
MSIINNLRSFDYKYCNLAVLSVFALFQSSKCFFDRNSGDIIGSYITQKNISDNGTLTKDNYKDLKLKKLDSYGFWAILEDRKTKEYIYMKSKNLKDGMSKFLSLKEFKDKPYLLKKKLLGFTSNPFKESQTSEWIHTKTSKTTFQSNPTRNNAGIATLTVFLLGFFCTLAFGAFKSVDIIKTLPCVNFIKTCCKENTKVTKLIGKDLSIRNLEGKLTNNYFNGDVIVSGNDKKQLLLNVAVYRDSNNAPFKLITLNIKEVM